MSKRSNQVKWARFREERYAEYQLLALDLFDRKGYENVTVGDIAEVAGVTTRTLYRYFPTKEDFVLAYARRSAEALIDALADLEPCADPMSAVWSVFEETADRHGQAIGGADKWRRVAVSVPGIRNRVRGERMSVLMEIVTDYCERSLGLAPGVDIRPRAMAGMLCGAELAVMTFWEGPRDELASYFRDSRPVVAPPATSRPRPADLWTHDGQQERVP